MINLLYRSIKTSNGHRILQDDLNCKWTIHWLMEFNILKCKIMQITTHYNKNNFTYKMCTISLSTVTAQIFWYLHVSIINYPGVLMLIVRNQANCLLGFLICKNHQHRSRNMSISSYYCPLLSIVQPFGTHIPSF